MTVRNGVGRARFHAVAAKNASGIIDIVDLCVAFARGNPLRLGVFRCLDVDASGRAGRRAQEAANALFQSAFIPVQNVDAAITRLEMDGFFGIIFGDGFPQHVAESHAKALYERDERFASFPDHGWHRNECSKVTDAGQIEWASWESASYGRVKPLVAFPETPLLREGVH